MATIHGRHGVERDCIYSVGIFGIKRVINERDRWMSGLIIKLLEVTHGQWLYRNIQVHDIVSGVEATLRKEEILMEIEKQQELGTEGLAEEDKYLMEINLDDLETTSGEKQEYWLLAIRAARMATTLSNNSERVAATATEDHNT